MYAPLIVIAASATAIALCFLRVRWYRRRLGISMQRSDAIATARPPVRVDVVLDDSGFDLPSAHSIRDHSVFLKLEVRTTWIGRLLDPYIEVRHPAATCRQYFERGANGERFLNLSPLLATDACDQLRFEMRSRFLRWASRAALFAFAVPRVDESKILVLAPHPDDAELAAFGLYASRQSFVATITAGERGMVASPIQKPAAERSAEVRVRDSLSIPSRGNVPPDRCVNLVYPDGALADMHAAPDRSFSIACEATLSRKRLRASNRLSDFQSGGPDCRWNDLIIEIGKLIETVQPNLIACPHPLLEGHPDHVFTAIALASALQAVNLANPPLLLLYVVHCAAAPLYPFGPASAITSVAPGGEGAKIEFVYSHTLNPDAVSAKRLAIHAHHAIEQIGKFDLNPSPLLVRLRAALVGIISGTDRYTTNFDRRAVRPNEIFYAATPNQLEDMKQRFLSALSSRA